MLPEWFEEGFVSIGWDNATPHSTDATVDEIREHLRSDIPELPEGEVIRGAGIRRRFLDIAPDDLIVSPDGDALYVARASGDSEWHEGDDASALRHPVEWLNLDSPGSRAAVREETPSLWKRLRTLLTVSELTDDLEAVEALLDGGTHRVPTYADAAMIAAVSSQVAKRLFVPQSWLNEIVSLLNEKKQVIFYGPPGTGKTWFARELGRHVVASGGAVSLVQFHPAYAYEDFFEGYRPSHDGEGLDFRLRAGPLRRIADEARRAPDVPHLLVVDEINRGQIAKIFGELYFLLEYREEPIQLQYSPDEEFSLPENLFFIGTMNTADRSIALVDSALRRRFYFVGFFPQSEPLSEVLGEWLEAEGYPQDAAEYQRGLNAALADAGTDEEFAIGHAYFMTKHGSPDVNRIWARAILPLLEERFYGARKRGEIEEEFAPEAIRRRIEAKTEEAQTDS
jgi:5-methylcytosine-specific restriction protein B